ncbi:tail protein X [Francisella philomiragia]|uniref:Phage Tail Protein X family protein n=1 Tax=Francisella philomiragia TaxID=28110 RepID=A0A0B6D337_9GAMM|nr:tail protein X [Francisella philomiragia]AJI53291.1 phage Tail Protein X family protein [Francisella philomiragia]
MKDSIVATGKESLDKISYRIFGKNDDYIIKLFYKLNPHLHDLDLIIPMGTVIKVPFVIDIQTTTKKVRLWD